MLIRDHGNCQWKRMETKLLDRYKNWNPSFILFLQHLLIYFYFHTDAILTTIVTPKAVEDQGEHVMESAHLTVALELDVERKSKKMVEDHTRSPDDPDRNFLLRVVLLFWCGDYPGLGEVTNFSHAGYNQCHWCTDRGCHSKGLSRMVYGGYRR